MERSRVRGGIFSIRQLVVIGMLSGITIFMGVSGIGLIQLPIIKFSIMHVPVIIGAILEGPLVGGTIGLMFGLFSLYQNMTAPTLLSPLFLNPIVSIVPRMLIGVLAYYAYIGVKKLIKNEGIAIGASAVVGTLTNTVGVLGIIYLLFVDRYIQLMGITKEAAGTALMAVATTNGLPECIVAVLITVPVILAVRKARK